MNKKFVEMLAEDRFKPFTGKVVDVFNSITVAGGSKVVYIYHVLSNDGSKWAIKSGDELKKGSSIKVSKKMDPKEYKDGEFPKKKNPSYHV